MTDTEKNGAEATMPANDVNFLVTCLQNATGGTVSIDAAAVGEALGYTNTKSVANRISALKKKYSLPFTSGSSKGGAAKGDAALTTGSPKVPTTPSKNRVSKRVAAKKAAVTKTPKGKNNTKAKGHVKEKTEDGDATEDPDATEDGSGIEGGDELPDTPAKSDDAAALDNDDEVNADTEIEA